MEYINHYTLWTNHMRRTYRDEVSEESRKMIREYIKFDGRKPSEQECVGLTKFLLWMKLI